MRVHQLVATADYGDAVTNQMLEIDRRLAAWGCESHRYAQNIERRLRGTVRPDHEYEAPGRREDLLIYHYSVFCSNLELFRRTRGHKVLIYHNITPASFYQGYDRELEALCRQGRQALGRLRDCDLALGVSEFNRQELLAAGFAPERTGLLPIFLPLDDFAGLPADAQVLATLAAAGRANLLFVGRMAPNKRIEDVIRIFYCVRRYVNPAAHLWLVGRRWLPRYDRELDALVEQLGLRAAVTFAGQVSPAQLKAYYSGSQIFLCASAHEGFGVPLLEAMHFDLPVLARAVPGSSETLGQAGIRFQRPGFPEVAEMAGLLLSDQALRAQVIRRQRERLQDFAPQRVEAILREHLARLGVLA